MKLDSKTQKKLEKVIELFNSAGHGGVRTELRLVGSGFFRAVYALSSKYVLKIEYRTVSPHVRANKEEHELYRADPKNKAKCFLIPDTDGRFLVMERVTHIKEFENLYFDCCGGEFCNPIPKKIPKWVLEESNDRWQVGYNAAGKVVLYDYHTSLD